MEQVRLLQGGLNLDDSVDVMPPEDYRNLVNATLGKTYDGRSGVVENLLGTTAISVSSSYIDNNSVLIGVVRSNKDNLSYLFYYNGSISLTHCILKLENGTTSLVLQWSGLNFQRSKYYRINGGGVVGNLLYFTDNYNEPRCVHTTRYSGGSTPTTEEEILLIKRGPLSAPSAAKSISGSSSSIKLKDWQFACQYVYFDGQYSVLSPYSPLIKFGTALGETNYQSIVVGYPSETAPRLVKERKIFAREGDNGVWYEVGSVSRSTIGGSWSSSSISFNGNIGGPVLETIYQKPFELSPKVAKCMAISSNRLWFANYNDGYDKYSASNITINTSTITESAGSTLGGGKAVSGNSRYKYGFELFDSNGRSGGVVTSSSYVVSVGNMFSNTASDQPLYGTFSLDATLSSLPSWVAYVSIVVSDDLVKSSYMETRSTAILYSNGSDSSSISLSPTNKKNVYISLPATDERFVPQIDDVVSFTFNSSEQSLIITDVVNNATGGPTLICSFKNMGSFSSFEQRHIQIYRPKTETSEIFYYERTIGTVSGSSKNITLSFAPSIRENSSVNGTWSYRPMYSLGKSGTWNTERGRAFVETRVDGVAKKLYFKHSSTFIADTDVNGLSEFNVGDEGQVSVDAGEIQKFIPTVRDATESSTILAICNTDTYSVYVGESQLSTSDGTGFIVGSPNIIGDTRRQQAGYGTLHPESVIEKDGYVYWYDHLAKSYCRYATNGIYPISDYKMIRQFEIVAGTISKDDLAISGYDPFYRQTLIAFPENILITNETFKTGISNWVQSGSGVSWSWNANEVAIATVTSGSDTSKELQQVFSSLKPVGAYKSRFRLFVGSGSATLTVKLYSGSTPVQTIHNVVCDWGAGAYEANVQNVSFTASAAFDRVAIQAVLASGSSCVVSIGSYELWSKPQLPTLAFSSDRNRWINKLDYVPSGFAEASDYLISLYEDSILEHNNSSAFNIINGTTYTSKLELSFNDSPTETKEWKVIQVQPSPSLLQFSGADEQISDSAFKLTATNERSQSTTVLYDEFEVDEDFAYGTLLNDENSLGGLLDGDPMYSSTLQVQLEWGGTAHKWIKFLKAGFQPSRGHTL